MRDWEAFVWMCMSSSAPISKRVASTHCPPTRTTAHALWCAVLCLWLSLTHRWGCHRLIYEHSENPTVQRWPRTWLQNKLLSSMIKLIPRVKGSQNTRENRLKCVEKRSSQIIWCFWHLYFMIIMIVQIDYYVLCLLCLVNSPFCSCTWWEGSSGHWDLCKCLLAYIRIINLMLPNKLKPFFSD